MQKLGGQVSLVSSKKGETIFLVKMPVVLVKKEEQKDQNRNIIATKKL
jgi:hypothetical protein